MNFTKGKKYAKKFHGKPGRIGGASRSNLSTGLNKETKRGMIIPSVSASSVLRALDFEFRSEASSAIKDTSIEIEVFINKTKKTHS